MNYKTKNYTVKYHHYSEGDNVNIYHVIDNATKKVIYYGLYKDCVDFVKQKENSAKVYLVCPECDDPYFGYSSPVAAFDSEEKAWSYAKEHYTFCIFEDGQPDIHATVIELDIQ